MQLAKQALDPLMPGAGADRSLGVVTTGGSAAVEVGPTDIGRTPSNGPRRHRPRRASSQTWDGLTRAAELLPDRPAGSVGTVVAVQRSGRAARIPQGSRALVRTCQQRRACASTSWRWLAATSIAALTEMVETLGGSMTTVASDEQLAGAFDDVAASLQGRFRVAFPAPAGADALGAADGRAWGRASTEVAYAAEAVRSGSESTRPDRPRSRRRNPDQPDRHGVDPAHAVWRQR